jgi:hypothetical protein
VPSTYYESQILLGNYTDDLFVAKDSTTFVRQACLKKKT